MNDVTYSLVIPVFNAEETLAETFRRASETLASTGESFEMIFVDDGSTDSSWQLLDKLQHENPGMVISVSLSRNFGQHNATLCGFGFAKGRFVITMDDDLQTPPEEMLKLIAHHKEHETTLIYGYYSKKQHSVIRNTGSSMLKKAGKILAKNPGQGSSFRLIEKGLVDRILTHVQNFVFIDELLLWYTSDIGFVEVTHEKSHKNQPSSYSNRKIFGLAANIMIYYSSLPLRIMIWGGFLSSSISFLFGIYFLVRKFLHMAMHGYTSIIVAILFSTSIIVFSIGILGEYLNRLYMVQNRKPSFYIKKVLK